MKKINLSASLLTTTVGLVMGTSINQIAIAEEVVAKSLTQPVVTQEVVAELTTQPVVTQEVVAESTTQPQVAPEYITTSIINLEKTEANQPISSFSYNAADLLAKRPLDLDKFCKNYPLNSRCTNPPSEAQEEQPKPTEENTSQAPKKTSGWAITPEIGTLGFGATVTRSVTPNLNAKLGISGFGFGVDTEESGVKYEGDLNLFNVSTLVDYHPWKKSGFRLTGGLVFQDNNVEANARSTSGGTIRIGDRDYLNPTVKAKVYFPNSVAPYLGIGWGNAVKPNQRLSFSANLGVMFPGSPKAELTGTGIDLADLEKERRELEDAVDYLSVYPVLSVGLSYQF